MMKISSKNAYFKQLKNGRLKFITRLYLHHCGRRDARKKTVREDENGFYISPFICQEIHLYNFALQIEKERLASIIMPTQAKIDVFNLQITQKTKLVDNAPDAPKSITHYNLDSEQAIAILKAKQTELSLLKDTEMEIGELRNDQLYSILQAKISAYWEGVLQVCGDDPKIPPIAAISHLIQGGEPVHETN